MGSPWHRRGWQMGDDSSDLACAGKVSAVGSVALTKALCLGSGLFQNTVTIAINVWAVGQDGGGRRGQRTQEGAHCVRNCRTPHTGCSRAWPHPFAPAVAAVRSARSHRIYWG